MKFKAARNFIATGVLLCGSLGLSAGAAVAVDLNHSSKSNSSNVTEIRYIGADASAQDSSLTDAQLQQTFDKYLVTSGKNLSYDTSRATQDGVPANLVSVMSDANSFNSSASSRTPNVQTYRVTLPGYGNWCGPLHSGPGAPINRLDSACMYHDKCYGNMGYFNTLCDLTLIANIKANFKYMGFREKAMAIAIAGLFGVKIVA